MKEPALEDETLDDVVHGRLKILQKARGYRFSVDALLLAHFVRLNPQDRVLELGTGSGIISLLLASRSPMAAITGIEVQAELAAMARRSVALNGLGEKIVIREGDVRDIERLFPAHSFDVVVSNPPYRKAASGRINPVPEKALARHELMGTVKDFLQAAGYVLRLAGGGVFFFPAPKKGGGCVERGGRQELKKKDYASFIHIIGKRENLPWWRASGGEARNSRLCRP